MTAARAGVPSASRAHGTARTPEAPEAGARRFYHPELDSLRFCAFLMVFLHHAFAVLPEDVTRFGEASGPSGIAAHLVQAGRFGVDLFFVLSSYLITELLLREVRSRGALDVRSFYIRRALRIWPLYYTFVIFAIWGAPHLLPHERFTWPHPIWYSLLAGNWSVALFGYPASVAAPLWSVSIEEQFYLVWPLLIAGLGAARMRRAAIWMIVIGVVSRLVLAALHAPDRAFWTVTPARLDPIALGALLALALAGRAPQFGRATRVLLFLAGPATWTMLVIVSPGGWANVLLYPLVALGAVGMLVATLGVSDRSLLAAPVLVFLGRISYGLYVYHVLAIGLASRLVPGSSMPLALASRVGLGFLLTVSLAMASYRWLEMPFLRLKVRFTHVPSRI